MRHARTFAGLTLVSRVLGLARDAILARLFGVTALGTAFAIAFQFPNTFRRLFGEGALSAAFIPEYAQLLKRDPGLAARFSSLVVAVMTAALGAVVVIMELALFAALVGMELPENGRRAVVLLALMLPFMPTVCLTAILGGMLQTHGRFAAQAGAPIVLNLCMIAAALVGSRALGWSAESTALAVAASVSVAGVIQTLWCLHDLRSNVTWSRAFDGVRGPAARMFRRMLPVIVGLGALQVSTLIESWVIVAWPIYQGGTILGSPYPLDVGAGAALTNAQRLYQFPLGIFGIALATAAFPALARLADEPARFAATLRRSIRLAAFIGLPATAGLIWVSSDLVSVVYEGGAISAADAARIARCLVNYAALVGTYSVTHVLTRAFYAKGDTGLPTKVSLVTIVLSLGLSVALMWPMKESGLAMGSSLAAVVQLLALGWLAHRRLSPDRRLLDRGTAASIARSALATGMMLAGLWALGGVWDTAGGRMVAWVRLGWCCGLGGAMFLATALVFCRTELAWLRGGPPDGAPRDDPGEVD
ncbi:MAG: murein biosynthesis integral membrane protein MurJ [Phycisphaerae bacterium]|nr:murein biosynthesis integral membrane protein MurJ [Phycisphaerae bacterium]